MIISTSIGKDKEHYKKKVGNYSDRYDEVYKIAKQRADVLDQALPIVRDHDTNRKIVEDVIKQAEPVLESLEPVGIEPEKGNNQVRKIKVNDWFLFQFFIFTFFINYLATLKLTLYYRHGDNLIFCLILITASSFEVWPEV